MAWLIFACGRAFQKRCKKSVAKANAQSEHKANGVGLKGADLSGVCLRFPKVHTREYKEETVRKVSNRSSRKRSDITPQNVSMLL